MTADHARLLLPLVVKDLVVLASSREDFEPLIEPLAKRRTATYANPKSGATGEPYWTGLATAFAPIGPPAWIPMSGLIEQGSTLEGGAKGFRGFFKKEPSEKERRRVLKIATLAARVMAIVTSAGGGTTRPEESRLSAMSLASFGLNADELERAKPTGAMTFESLEIFGDLDARTRRELVRGAWQLAIGEKIEPARELAVRGIAARLELPGPDADLVRADVIATQSRRAESVAVAIELVRSVARLLPVEAVRPWLEHLVEAAAPLTRKSELQKQAQSTGPTHFEAFPKMESPYRRQAIVLAYATLMGHDPSTSTSLRIRAELRANAASGGLANEVNEAISIVDRVLSDRIRESCSATTEASTATAPAEQAPTTATPEQAASTESPPKT